MADDRKDLNKGKNMGAGHQQGGQHAPGREVNDNPSTGGRSGAGVQGSNRESGFDREDREREQPGSKQRDQRDKNS